MPRTYINTCLHIVKVKVSDDVVLYGILQTLRTHVCRRKSFPHTQFKLTIGQFSCLK